MVVSFKLQQERKPERRKRHYALCWQKNLHLWFMGIDNAVTHARASRIIKRVLLSKPIIPIVICIIYFSKFSESSGQLPFS